jgi:hypothetical protein
MEIDIAFPNVFDATNGNCFMISAYNSKYSSVVCDTAIAKSVQSYTAQQYSNTNNFSEIHFDITYLDSQKKFYNRTFVRRICGSDRCLRRCQKRLRDMSGRRRNAERISGAHKRRSRSSAAYAASKIYKEF